MVVKLLLFFRRLSELPEDLLRPDEALLLGLLSPTAISLCLRSVCSFFET